MGHVHSLPTLPRPPADFSPAERAEWWEIMAALDGYGLLFEETPALLAERFRVWSEMTHLDRFLNEHGLFTTSKSGLIRERPESKRHNRLFEEFLELSKRVGLTPASRQRLLERRVWK
jgi:P27 family predicted phage terminase small subunit